MFPYNAVVAIPVAAKGASDAYAVDRLAAFVKGIGVSELVCMSDQEGSLKNFFEAAMNKRTIDGLLVRAVPESSAVGESQSNGLAERSVQLIEVLIRTYKLELEDRM